MSEPPTPELGEFPARWLDRWSELTPDAIALTHNGSQLTYGELLERVRQWTAIVLQVAQPEPGVVALCMPRGIEQVVAYLAIMRAGAIALVIGDEEPASRRADILHRAQTDAVIFDDNSLTSSGWPGTHLSLSEIELGAPADGPTISPHQPAHLVFTSGSTGAPKAIVASHARIARTRTVNAPPIPAHEEERFGHLMPFSWTACWMDLFVGLSRGARVCLCDPQRAGLGQVTDWFTREQITALSLPSPLFRNLLALATPGDPRFASLRFIKLVAARVQPSDLRPAFRVLHPRCQILVSYGTSEAGLVSRVAYSRETPIPSQRLPVGFPVAGVDVRIIDDDGTEVSPGEVGNVEVTLTNVVNTWNLDSSYRLSSSSRAPKVTDQPMRTGDLGRWTHDGQIDLIGRNNARVKVNAQAVDLNEVEAALTQLDSVEAAVVLIAPGNPERLVAVVAGAHLGDSHETFARMAQTQLTEWLPSYAIPTAYFLLSQMPVTNRGKIDRIALTNLATTRLSSR